LVGMVIPAIMLVILTVSITFAIEPVAIVLEAATVVGVAINVPKHVALKRAFNSSYA
jgi:hypothetical protein